MKVFLRAVLLSSVFALISSNILAQPDPSTLTGKFMLGYQGWRSCTGDGSALNCYTHWSFNLQQPSTNNVVMDIWPDMSELTAGEQFSTSFTLGNGQAAKAYSDYLSQTTARHFSWMQANNLDGVFLQRFIWDVKGSGNAAMTAHHNQVATDVKTSAGTYSRVFALMYDLSGEPSAQLISDVQSDWAYVTGTLQLTNSSRYLKHNGKPVVAIWGIGFTGINLDSTSATTLINWFKNNGCTVMGGVPYYWRTLSGDSQTNAAWTGVYHSLSVLSPWSVGRYNNASQADANASLLAADLADCQANGVDYMPVAFPGYSAYNLNGGTLNQAARLGGSFFWRQIYNTFHAGCNMIYGAMFDEIDEGTALFKLAPTMQTTPSVNTNTTSTRFFALDVDGYSLPSDWYLRCTAAGTRVASGANPLTSLLPITPTNSLTVTAPNGGEVLTAGNAYTVTWTSTGTVGNVNIDVSTDSGKSFRALIYNIGNTGSKSITVPYYGNTTCRLRVESTNGVPIDWSDSNFTIQTPTLNPNTHLSKLWSLAPGDRPYLLASGSTERGIAYDSLSDKVFIVHRQASTPQVYVLDGTSGADLYTLNTNGISGGGFVLDRIAVADDGAIYAGNVANPGSGSLPVFKMYRWANNNSNTVPTLAYSGAAGFGTGIRVGDTFALRGAGTNTQVLLCGRGTNTVSMLTTADGVNFTAKILTTTLGNAQVGSGVAFGMTNTYWVKTNSNPLIRLSYDYNAGTSTTLNSFSGLPPGFSPFAVDETNNLLVDIDIVDGYDQMNLYDISNLGTTPVLLHSFTFPADNDNSFGVGTVCFGNNDRVYALDSDNGVIAASVLRKVVITVDPQSQTVNQGANVTFNVTATGSTLSYQWKKNGAAISGATLTSLVLTNVQSSDAATYTVDVSNSFSSDTSANAILTVIVPPSITVQPVSRTSNYGTTATFTVTATGTSPSYQWQKNTVDLANGGNVSGATSTTLSLTNVTENDSASYRVIVSNAAGSVTSSVATLTLVDPIITAQPQNQSVNQGGNATFSVSATGTPTLGYQWRKDGTAISGASTSSLTITNAQTSDQGSYSVVVSNAYGSPTSANAILTIVTPPVITVQPVNSTNNAGSLAIFSVTASGGGLSYQWLRNGTNLVNGGKISGATTAALSLSTVLTEDQASYSVVITNSAGSATSSAATLAVLYPMPYKDAFSYPVGANLGGQTNADYLIWYDIATSQSGNYVTVSSNSLSVTGLIASVGNSIKISGLGKSARFSFAPGTAVTNSTLYYSYALKVTNLGTLDTTGLWVAGFNNSTGTQTGQPTVVGTRLYLRATNSGFNIGTSKNSSTSTEWVWSPTVFATNQTIFIVGSYTFTTVGVTNDDIAKMWINPATNTFGAGSPPTATLTATNGPDLSSDQIASFVFCQRSANEPTIIADELRIAKTWAQVTPPAGSGGKVVVLAISLRARAISPSQVALILSAPSEMACTIQTSSDMVNWSDEQTVVTGDGDYQWTEPVVSESRFYRAVQK